MWFKWYLILACWLLVSTSMAKSCVGHLVNPLTDICWRCLFPLSIGNTKVVHAALPDTENASSPLATCPAQVGMRVGLAIGFWEPIALVDVTDTPYCLVNLGGVALNLGAKHKRGGYHVVGHGQSHAFFHVHWYKYPLLYWLNLVTSVSCLQTGDLDIAYMTELDPTWSDNEMNLVLNPDAFLFANPIAQAACSADALSSTFAKKPLDNLFWCAGSQGSHYPMTGHVTAPVSPLQTSLLLAERLNYKLHRLLMITDSSPKPGAICRERHYPITPKSRYRYELVNQVVDGKHCYPSGFATLAWESLKIKPHKPNQVGFLVWRKRNCVFW